MKKRSSLLMLVPLLFSFFAAAAWADTALPQKKQTTLGLYITAKDAYAKWQADQNNVKILDVRTPGEYIFVGHAPMATNIPIEMFNGAVDPATSKPVMPVNGNFVAEVKKRFKDTDTIMIMCRSGARSAAAVNELAKAGFKNAYTITDGFEGDTDANGMRTVNGWKNSDAPWTYKLDTKLAYLP